MAELHARGFTADDAARAAGVTPDHLRNVGRSITRPSPALVAWFERIFGYPIYAELDDWAMTGEHQPGKNPYKNRAFRD